MDLQKISSFHTHTKLCNHAEGMPEDYVKKAILQGCSELGFSDHCPYPAPLDSQWSNCRMSLSQIELYKKSVEDSKNLADFPIHFGFECEYDKNFISWYKDELKGHYGAEYLVFGPHWVVLGDSINSRPYILDINRDKNLLHRYTNQTIEGIQSGIYSFLAHPDLFMLGWKKWDDDAKSCLKAILDCAIDSNLPLEINGLGLLRLEKDENGKEYGYPYKKFWEMVAQSNAKVICNSDAHFPKNVINCARASRAFCAQFGITPIETIF